MTDSATAGERRAAADEAAMAPAPNDGRGRLAILDGWRATSILLVLAGHLLPLGPKRLAMNGPVAGTGMVLFFILSGFLITRFLAERAELRAFIIRRFFRIVPLAWLAMLVALPLAGATGRQYLANLFFFANLPPFYLVAGGGHLWSLCLEMQFYVGIALWVALFGRRGFHAMPLLCLAVTGLRVATGSYDSIVTWLRIDEILAGSVLALAYGGWFGPLPERLLARVNVYAMLPLLLLATHPVGGPLNYARPYIAAVTVGATLFNPPPLLARLYASRAMIYVATVSYALYVIHGVLMATWFGSGSKLVKYAKRPLLIAATFGLAHLSTYRLEQPCIRIAKRLTRGLSIRAPA